MNKVKLTRKQITIKLENNDTQIVPAWTYNDTLAWHKGVSNGQWILTHLATGYKLTEYHGKYGRIREMTKDLILISDFKTNCHAKLTSIAKLCNEIIRSYE